MALTVPQAAARIRRDPETIRRWVRTGRLRSRKIGTQHILDEQELDALVAGAVVPLPKAWRATATGEPMPDIMAALGRSRQSRR